MTDQAATDRVKQAEDAISKFFEDSTFEFDLRAMKFLRIRHPNQSSQLSDLEYALAVERRKVK